MRCASVLFSRSQMRCSDLGYVRTAKSGAASVEMTRGEAGSAAHRCVLLVTSASNGKIFEVKKVTSSRNIFSTQMMPTATQNMFLL